ncbi:hypothetical protein [Streptomyces avicenniae]|uniref:hypothetical protein n=1 Tax=Streptomyces avicenniae TaxID=500153 RepID=UPI00069C6A18|nr:hypothetical protein [Streptomyces avicenniae]
MTTELRIVEMRLAELRRQAEQERLASVAARGAAARRRAEGTRDGAPGPTPGAAVRRWTPWRRANA